MTSDNSKPPKGPARMVNLKELASRTISSAKRLVADLAEHRSGQAETRHAGRHIARRTARLGFEDQALRRGDGHEVDHELAERRDIELHGYLMRAPLA